VNIIMNIFVDVLQITKFYILCDYFLMLSKKGGVYRKGIVYMATVVISIAFSVLISNPTVILITYLVFVFLIYIFEYDETKGKLFMISIWSNLIICILDQISNVIVVTVNTIFANDIDLLDRVFKQMLTVGFLLVIGTRLGKKHRNGIKDIAVGYYLGFTVLSFADLAILVYLSTFAIDKVKDSQKMTFELVFLFVSVGMLIQMAMVIFLAVSRNVYRENEQLASQYLNEQKKYYEYLETRERKTKKFRHDLRSHMFIINALNKKKDYDKLEEYLDKMNGEIETFGNVICVNNGIVDAILNKFYDEAERSGIKVEVIGHFPSDCNISAFDLCTIFSNLLRNAMEAEQESKKSVIKVSCGYTKDMIVLSIENDSVGKKVEIDGKIETSKQDKWNHGFGLENVQECVKRNQGELLIESEQNRFKVMVLLARVEQL